MVLTAGDERGDAIAGRRVFDAFYERHATSTLAVVLALRGPDVVADEVVQEAFTRALQRWEEVGRMDRPDLWVQRVALNLATSRLRRLASERRALTRLGQRQPVVHSPVFEAEQRFWELVRRLPAKQARVVALHYAGELSVREIAEVVGTATGTVKAQLHTARQRLRQLITPSREEQEQT